MLREDIVLGVIGCGRREVQPFTAKQIELVQTFADQAVIAIENTRLFEQLQARTLELQESLEYQMATSDVLQVISSSPGQLQPVYETMLSKALRHCDAKFGGLFRYERGVFQGVAGIGIPEGLLLGVEEDAGLEQLLCARDQRLRDALGEHRILARNRRRTVGVLRRVGG